MLKSVLREPLVHFLALGFLVFAVYATLDRPGREDGESIVIGPAKIEQIAVAFARTWQRPPTPAELKSSRRRRGEG